MKRTGLIFVTVVLILATALAGCTKANDKVKVVTDATFAPFEFTDESGNMVGFDIDLMNEIAKKAGIEIEWTNIGFDSAEAGMATCQYDAMIAAMSITDARKLNMLFTAPYLDAGLIVVVNKENTDIESIDDLKGKTVAAQLGTTGEIAAQKIEGVTYKPYDSYELALLELANKGVDAVIVDNPVAIGYIAANPEKIKTAGDVFNSEQYAIAVCKTEPELLTKLDTALKALIEDGTVATIAAKYLQ